MPKFEVGDEFMSEGHRFRVTTVAGRAMVAEEVSTGRTREASIGEERAGEADLEWMDGNPRWHEQGAQQLRQPTVLKGDPPGEPIGPSRFDRDFDFED